mmetsp:Transcript_50958/g.101345  ORF Transcript_50958/g.101345 Transcript_50958/m.101345 type:complete len:203 (+) Transcript_50958:1677-2285(+)
MLDAPTLRTTSERDLVFAPERSSSPKLPSGRSRETRQTTPLIMCRARGMRYESRHERLSSSPVKDMKMRKMYGIVRLVIPPPRLPQPAAVAFAIPTTFLENICEHHVWHATKVASEKPMMHLRIMNCHALVTNMMRTMAGVVPSSRMPSPRRAPNLSQIHPIASLKTIVPQTAMVPERDHSSLERLRSGMMYADRDAAANVE